MNNIKLSAVIITFNEEKNIERCLKSLQTVADEIVVLDSFSTDNTEEICKKYNVIFFQHAFDGHIEQKNRAISFAKYKYILSLDADEVLSIELINSIQEIKRNCLYDAYSFNRLNNYCGKWIKNCGWYPDVKTRIINKEFGRWGGENPHDKLLVNDVIAQKHIDGDLLHYTYYTIDDHVNQANKFSAIAAKQKIAVGKKFLLLRAIISPIVKFIKSYFIKRGFLEGYRGLIISIISSHETFLKYAKAYHIKKLTANK